VPDLVITFTNPSPRGQLRRRPARRDHHFLTASRLKVKGGRCHRAASRRTGCLKSAPSTDTLLWMPRCPATVSSSPSGPCTVATLGVRSVRLRKLRPCSAVPPRPGWQPGGGLDLAHVDHRRRRDRGPQRAPTARASGQVYGLTHRTGSPSASARPGPRPGPDLVAAEREQRRHEHALLVGGHVAGKRVCTSVTVT